MTAAAGITMRIATSEDAALVHAMIIEMAEAMDAGLPVTSSAEDFVKALSGNARIHALIAEQDKQPVGVTIFFPLFSTWRGTYGVYVQDIYVAPRGRGAGIGKKMLAEVAAWGAERGVDHLRLSVDRENSAARTFYESIGMSYCDIEMIYQVAGSEFNELGSTK